MSNNEEPRIPLELMQNIMGFRSAVLCVVCANSSFMDKRAIMCRQISSLMRNETTTSDEIDDLYRTYSKVLKKRKKQHKLVSKVNSIKLLPPRE